MGSGRGRGGAAGVETAADGLRVEAEAACTGRTGVEMEALTAATVALLTLYDMCKALQRDMTITDVRLESKSGGRSGDWRRDPEDPAPEEPPAADR